MSWLQLPEDTGFGLDNLPLGIFSTPGTAPRTGVRIGGSVLDLARLSDDPVHATGSLNAWLSGGPMAWRDLRSRIVDVLLLDRPQPLRPCATSGCTCRSRSPTTSTSTARGPRGERRPDLPPGRRAAHAELAAPADRLPRAGRQRRRCPELRSSGPADSGSSPTDDAPTFGPSRRLDIEAEVGFVVGTPSEPGTRVPVGAVAVVPPAVPVGVHGLLAATAAEDAAQLITALWARLGPPRVSEDAPQPFPLAALQDRLPRGLDAQDHAPVLPEPGDPRGGEHPGAA